MSRTHSWSFLRTFSIWMLDACRAMVTESTSHSMLAFTSSMSALFQAMMDASSPMWAMCLTAFFSSVPRAGLPASIWGTPASSRSWAILYFSMLEKTAPAACSPNPRVESQMQRGALRQLMTSFLLFMLHPLPPRRTVTERSRCAGSPM